MEPSRIRNEYLDVNEAAAEIGVYHTTIRKMFREVNGLRHVTIARKLMTKREWIQEYLDRRTVKPNPTRGRK